MTLQHYFALLCGGSAASAVIAFKKDRAVSVRAGALSLACFLFAIALTLADNV